MSVAVFTPTRHPGIAPSFYSVARQRPRIDHWLIADQLAPQRQPYINLMRKEAPWLNIETFCPEILPERNGSLERSYNWALKRARELDVDLLVSLQDYIWVPADGVKMFTAAAKRKPFDLLTGYCYASSGPKMIPSKANDPWSIFNPSDAYKKPPEPYTLDTRDTRYTGDVGSGVYLTNHAWEINYGAIPHALINAGVDFDEDYDYGTQWGNTDFSFNIAKAFEGRDGGRVWWDYGNRAVSMPHRDYFVQAHAGERDLDNGHRFWAKHPELAR